MATAQPITTLTSKELARFESYVDRTTPGQGPPTASYAGGACCEWRGYRGKKGYGQFWLRGKMEKAHRVAYLIEHGHWPNPCGLHEVCDNPPCCEAAHISEGTVAENNAQMRERGRAASGEAHSAVMRRVAARGDANGSRLYPERLARGDTHGSRTHPERRARGDANGSRTHPERLARGDTHGSRTHPERVARGEANGRAKYSDEIIAAVYTATGTYRDIAAQYGISYGYVGRIKSGESRTSL